MISQRRRLVQGLCSVALVLGCAGLYSMRPGAHHAQATTPIKHIVFIIKENHSFDNYFGLFPGVNGANSGTVRVSGVVHTIPLGPFQEITPYDYRHGWYSAHVAYDNGAMDRFNQGNCTMAPYPCYQAATRSDLPNYWTYAQKYLLNDNTFSDLVGPSFPNHMFTVAGAAGPDSQHSAIDNPGATNNSWGCGHGSDQAANVVTVCRACLGNSRSAVGAMRP